MKAKSETTDDKVALALEAIGNLLFPRLDDIFSGGWTTALMAHSEIELLPVPQKAGAFYRNFLPLFKNVVLVLVESYRRYLKLALAHSSQAGWNPDDWAWAQLRPAVGAAVKCLLDWYEMACEGSNQYVQPMASVPFQLGQTISIPIPLNPPEVASRGSWRAPAWLFAVGPMVGIGPLKTKNVPETNSEEKLSAAHTRLLLKGARRVFLWKLAEEMKTVRNEEIAAAGAIPAATPASQGREPRARPKHWLEGTEGLGPKKANLSEYTLDMTDKQELAFSLKYEYELRLGEIASRMGIDRTTAREHLDAANKKLEQNRAFEKRKANRSKNNPEE